MAKRKAISNGTRFQIFQRDRFTCAYCGQMPPKVILHVDHIIPFCDGGSNEESNLITACQECNLGKGVKHLKAPIAKRSVDESIADRKERLQQVTAMSQFLLHERKQREEIAQSLGIYWCNALFAHGPEKDKYSWTQEQLRSVILFLGRMPEDQIYFAMDRAISKFPYAGRDDFKAFRYFCGICW